MFPRCSANEHCDESKQAEYKQMLENLRSQNKKKW